MIELVLFVSTFVVVFALGFQSLNVNGGHFALAFLTSFAIGGANLVLWKVMPNSSASEMFAYLAGGPFGIVASMLVHRRLVGRRELPGASSVPPARTPPRPRHQFTPDEIAQLQAAARDADEIGAPRPVALRTTRLGRANTTDS